MKFEDLIGKTFDFYGVAGTMFKLDDMIFHAIEAETLGWADEYDDRPRTGYYLKEIEHLDPEWVPVDAWFLAIPLARVKIFREGVSGGMWCGYDYNGYTLVDDRDHVWLSLGTRDGMEFRFMYEPPDPIKMFFKIEDPVAQGVALMNYLLENQKLSE